MLSNIPEDTRYNLTNIPRIMDVMVGKFLPNDLDTIREAYFIDSDPKNSRLENECIQTVYTSLKNSQ